ncbi:MAG: hypothetical protein IPK64_18065 [bacterium]|nr:hypothetical protein [bacterium]
MIREMRPCGSLLLLGVFLAIAGCASTKMTSRVDPAIVGNPFRKILVHGNFQDLDNREVAEDKLCEKIAAVSVSECVRALDLFFPGRQYSSEEMMQVLAANGIDGVLVVQPTNSGTQSSYIPQTSHTTGSASVAGNSVFGSSTTTTSGGYSISKPWATYASSLYSVERGNVVWYATAQSSGNAYASWHDLIRSACGKTIDKLANDGAIPTRRDAFPGHSPSRR